MKTYFVTGGAGFIGSNFILYMLKHHTDIRIINIDKLTYAANLENLASIEKDSRYIFSQTDICDKEQIEKLFAFYQPDYVVNFAAESHVDRSIENPNTFVTTNVFGTVNMLDCARNVWEDANGSYGKHKFLQVSTDEVYGSLSLDDPESLFYETTPLAPHSPYSASKAAADYLVLSYAHTYGLPINITRCSNNYGPRQFEEKLIPLMINNALKHKQLPIYGDGLNVRDWLYVEDHCKAIDLVCTSGKQGEIYNIGGHNERPNISIVKLIISEVRKASGDQAITEKLIRYVDDRKGHDRRYAIAFDKITEDLGWHPETKFEDGIITTVAWYLEKTKCV